MLVHLLPGDLHVQGGGLRDDLFENFDVFLNSGSFLHMGSRSRLEKLQCTALGIVPKTFV